MSWLGDGINDRIERSNKDYENIADVISDLQPDILAVQEIENADAINRVLKYQPGYSFICGETGGKQRVGLLYRKTLALEFVNEYMPLAVVENETRAGLLLKGKKRNFDFYIMAVHLKSTSRYDSTSELLAQSRMIRETQAEILARWADSTLFTGSENDIFILGDLNDFPFRKHNQTLDPLYFNENLSFLTDSVKSCKFIYSYSIDHIIVSNSPKSRLRANSLFIYNINNKFTPEELGKISDHCPVIAKFDVTAKDND
jgi:exonuclease III